MTNRSFLLTRARIASGGPWSRRGSVLILVVALLVLLALVGTAYLTTSRVDRYAVRQFDDAQSNQLTLEGWNSTVRAQIIDDLFDETGAFRPVTNPQDDSFATGQGLLFSLHRYENFDSPQVVRDSSAAGQQSLLRHGDEWLASRHPAALVQPHAVVNPNTNPVVWPFITGPLLDAGWDPPFWVNDPTSGTAFEPPRVSAGGSSIHPLFRERTNVLPTTIRLAQPSGAVTFPALQVFGSTGSLTMLAADADGDGIADSGLEKIFQKDDVTFYVAARVVDSNSAINLNTAMSQQSDFAGNGAAMNDNHALRNSGLPGLTTGVTGVLPAHVGLYEMLRSYGSLGGATLGTLSTELNQLNNWRFGFNWPSGAVPRAQGVEFNTGNYVYPIADETYQTSTLIFRDDIAFNSVGEALWMQLGRRKDNPGIQFDGAAGSLTFYRPIDVNVSAALAFGGGVIVNKAAAPTDIETRLHNSLLNTGAVFNTATINLRRDPYSLNTSGVIEQWYEDNFRFDRETPLGNPASESWVHRRTVFTSFNPTSSAAPVGKVTFDFTPASPNNGDTRTYAIPQVIARYAGTSPNPTDPYNLSLAGNFRKEIDRSADPNFPGRSSNTRLATGSDTGNRPASKVDVNHATFGELWRGFWQVMAEPEMKIIPPGVGTFSTRGFTGQGDNFGTPFTDYIMRDMVSRGASTANDAVYDPYLGSSFTGDVPAGTLGLHARSSTQFPPVVSNFWNGAAARYPAVGWHPARMFRSPLRGVPDVAAGFSAATFRMPADQVVLLRSAIAAVNAEQLRRRDDNLVVRTIVADPTGSEAVGNSLLVYGRTHAGGISPNPQPVTVRIFGVGRQPFITEVYAQTDNQTVFDSAGGNKNLNGYIAIEFFNPYPVPIDLRNCRFVAIDRTPAGPYNTSTPPALVLQDLSSAALPSDERIVLDPGDPSGLGPQSNTTTRAGILDPFGVASDQQLIVPPRGWLVMENYPAPGTTIPAGAGAPAYGRPGGTNLNGVTTASAPPASDPSIDGVQGAIVAEELPRANFVYVPNLHRLLNREFVLVRTPQALLGVGGVPLTATWTQSDYRGATPTARTTEVIRYAAPDATMSVRDLAPLDSYDLTGLAVPGLPGSGITQMTAWWYSRACSPNKMWRFVYPGRYDGGQPWEGSALLGPGEPAYPRQQGTRQYPTPYLTGMNDPNVDDPWFNGGSGIGVNPGVNLGTGGLGALSNERENATYTANVPSGASVVEKGEFTLPLRSLDSIQSMPGVNPPFFPSGPGQFNRAPYGGFARNLDVLQVPFVGAYWVQHAADYAAGPFAADRERMIEINPITLDSAFADDTDVNTDPTVERTGEAVNANLNTADVSLTETVQKSREQIGRFCPLRPSLANGQKIDDPQNPSYGIGNPTSARYGDYFDGAQDRDAWRYQWAKRIFDVFTVQNPEDDGLGGGNEQAYSSVGLPPPQTVLSTLAASRAKTVAARVIGNSSGANLTTTNLPAWLIDAAARGQVYVTFLSITGDPGGQDSTGKPRYPNFGQRRKVNSISNPSGSPPQCSVNVDINGLDDPRPWEPGASAVPAGTLVLFQSTPEGPGGIEGLININTASARVLSTIPWFPPEEFPATSGNYRPSVGRVSWNTVTHTLTAAHGLDTVDDNWDLAQAIAWYRDRERNSSAVPAVAWDGVPGGPFTSIFDLYRCPAFKLAQETILNVGVPGQIASVTAAGSSPPPNANGRDVSLQDGDMTYTLAWPNGPDPARYTDSVRFDYKEQFLLLNRVSNLITTRSDTFTVYTVLQAWRNAGTEKPELLKEWRDAFIVDRTSVTPNNRTMREYPVPTP